MENIYQDSKDNTSSESESKWFNIKLLLKKKLILENSINEIKSKIPIQFSSKLNEIYQEKLLIHSLIENNKKLISYWGNREINVISLKNNNYTIAKNLKELYSGPVDDIIKFFFYFRENHLAMIRLIKYIPLEKRKSLANFLCHFFYDNFFIENEDEEEILFIILFLLKEEIDNLLCPLSNNFLQDSFLKYFLNELGNKFEIRNYFDVILNPLIKDLEDKNSFNYNLNIIKNSKKHIKYNFGENKFFKMDNQDIKFVDYSDSKRSSKLGFFLFQNNKTNDKTNLKNFSKRNSQVIDIKKISTINNINNINRLTSNNINELNRLQSFRVKNINEIFQEDLQIKDYINSDFFFCINEQYFRALLRNEKNEIMKNFYLKQIKIINSSEDKNIFSCHECYKRIKNQKIISKLSVEQYNKTVETIKNFIDKLLNNLEKKDIIPYYIRIICKLIDILISKKFEKISKIKKNSLICQFLFGILVLPILENPDSCNSIGEMIISLNTRSILINIYDILKHLIEGCLFNSKENIYYTIFNNYIIKNYHRINHIIEEIINIKIPSEFYNINDIPGNNNKINEANFIYNKSICFNSGDFLLFYNTIHAHKDEILQKDKYIEDIYLKITKNLSLMKFKKNEYYIIIKDNNENNLTIKENNTEKKLNDKFSKLKWSIKYVLENLQFIIYFDKKTKTEKTFKIINDYLNNYFKPKLNSEKPPLSWYSQYIVNNLSLINNKYKENDYQLLYEEIIFNINKTIDEYKSLNDYLSTNLIIKINSIKKLISNYKLQKEKIKNSELNIKSLIFIQSNPIKICLMTGDEYNQLIKTEKKLIDNNLLLMSVLDTCPHKKKILSEKEIKYIEKKYHCNNIEEFAFKFGEYHKIISEEIMNFSLGSDYYSSKDYKEDKNIKIKNKFIDENSILTYSIKEILEVYMNIIKHNIENDNYIFSKDLINDKIIENKIINIIWNYILKSVCDPISIAKPLFLDNIFKVRCQTLQNIVKPENLRIPQEIFEKNLMMKINHNLKIIDELRTPGEIFNQFGIFIESINSLFKFFMNIGSVEPDELLNTIIYFVIYSNPERIIFKTNFCKFFLSENELIGNLGINIIQIESSLVFINKLEASQLGISQQEFNNICSKVNFS